MFVKSSVQICYWKPAVLTEISLVGFFSIAIKMVRIVPKTGA
jgi:hypothetical protein